MKEFATWVSEMANSIPDESTVSNKAKQNTLAPSLTYSELQLRVMLADRLMPILKTIVDCENWLVLLRVGVHRITQQLRQEPIGEVLSEDKELTTQFLMASDYQELITFIDAVRAKANGGK